MNKIFSSRAITTGLAIFSMLFGSGNLIFPLMIGLQAGPHTGIAVTGLILTAVLLPLLGLVSMIFFDGNYHKFFGRLGKGTGSFMILYCMLIIGPLIVMPRIVTVAFSMTQPFVPALSLTWFSIIFMGITFAAAYRRNNIVEILGKVVTPLLLISLSIIIAKGILGHGYYLPTTKTMLDNFVSSALTGYKTLDLLGTIFFGAIILEILRDTSPEKESPHQRAIVTLKSGLISAVLLGLVYVGLSFLGAWYGSGLAGDTIFAGVALRIMGHGGALVVATAVLMACFSTVIALAAVFAEYIDRDLSRNRLGYTASLAIGTIATLIPAHLGLAAILNFSEPIIMVGYPVIIAITVCNLAYKLWGFRFIKIPAFLTLVGSTAHYWMTHV
ncbi:hypothetical protein HOL34_03935 [bacterium]|jgi:branched-chain amino acid:cation transporter, LIVCS family|nr:hypothetical protein [bacterium]MBT3903244.1 hypothetical protein [bacterium]MBT4578138.1 hypothetical protein [bacterium]MBT5345568.1 hypothetical protein [bacterium]MBT6131073.1 hypothetical protein [bacterium]